MASGLGVEPTLGSSGNIVSGTTAQDIRKIYGALYSGGLVSGGAIGTSASDLSYTISAGVAMVETAAGQVVPVPFDAVPKLNTAAVTTDRTDIVYVLQRFPTPDKDSTSVVRVGTSVPANAVVLGQYRLKAGATNTSSAVKTGDITYSIPYGASMGILHHHIDTFSGQYNQSILRAGAGKIFVPTDRRLQVTITSVLYSTRAAGFDNSQWVEWMFQPELDNTVVLEWYTPGLTSAWATYTFSSYINVPAGSHTVSYKRGKLTGPGTASTAWGTQNGRYFAGTEFTVTDAGPAK